ncbi:MAG TPA: M50 family metallopeptidase [Lacipirellulaceae bacterium]|jgi:hypothetical protein|nr:M50 family metallopeptidase [Lacipirellulaceae bacterium]
MKRQPYFVLITATLAVSWLMMQAVHELGHVLAAGLTGGHVSQVVLHPSAISQTHLSTNPRPLFVAWMGPIVGSILPVLALLPARSFRWRGWYVLQFFAGFCVIANGAYLALGSFNHVGDAGDILRHGTSIWLLWLFGVITIPIGLWLWYGLGPYFGLGANPGGVDRVITITTVAILILTVALELVFSNSAVRP